MALQVTNYKAPILGSGSPDGTAEVALGQSRPGLSLKFNQRLRGFGITPTDRFFYPGLIPWVIPPIAPGAEVTMFNFESGIVMPYTIPKGSTLTLIQRYLHSNQDYECALYFDGIFADCFEEGTGVCPNTLKPSLVFPAPYLTRPPRLLISLKLD